MIVISTFDATQVSVDTSIRYFSVPGIFLIFPIDSFCKSNYDRRGNYKKYRIAASTTITAVDRKARCTIFRVSRSRFYRVRRRSNDFSLDERRGHRSMSSAPKVREEITFPPVPPFSLPFFPFISFESLSGRYFKTACLPTIDEGRAAVARDAAIGY